jgi:ribonuclease HII
MLLCGVDEAGRGPLAGPVIAAAVILDMSKKIKGLADSKLLLPQKREELFVIIQCNSLAWAIGQAEVEEIDQINILQASLLAMQRAIDKLTIKPQLILVDGMHSPHCEIPVRTIIHGDQNIPEICAASILAKVIRDQQMIAYAKKYPQYGFDEHKGYGTEQHLQAIKKYGITPIHRKSFAPVKDYIV